MQITLIGKSVQDDYEYLVYTDMVTVDGNHGYHGYYNHLISLGPCFLYKALNQTTYKARRNLLARNSVASKSSLMDLLVVIEQ